jgi:glycerophosphoryl diester phosphodiesterase
MIIHFAHRGSLTEAPENTIPAIKSALDRGAKAIEIDVQLCKDGQLVVWHDEHLGRIGNGAENPLIRNLTLKEIKRFDAGSWFSPDFKGTTVSTLEEILKVIPDHVFLNIEIKNPLVPYEGIEQKTLASIEQNRSFDKVIVSSFDHEALRRFYKLERNLKLGMLFRDRLISPWSYVKNCGFPIYSVHPHYNLLTQDLIHEFKNKGYKIYPYTVDDENTVDRLLHAGIDGVFTNNVHIFGE